MSARRYATMFATAAQARRPVLVPFAMLGFPDAARSLAACEAMIAGGADALELGLPFSEAIADGPVIQQAAAGALAAGFTVAQGFALVSTLRARHPHLPLGLLTYANLLEARGVAAFYRDATAAGLDSLLVADVPVGEFAPYAAAARAASIAPVLIVPPNAGPDLLAECARLGAGYTYLAGRSGVTGTHAAMRPEVLARVRDLAALGAPPCLLGFGISAAAEVEAAWRGGAAGAIVGSALVASLAEAPMAPEALTAQVAGLRRWSGCGAGC